MTTPFRFLGLDHVVLRARAPDALARFYRDALGCTLERDRRPEIALIQLRAGRSLIDIVDAARAPPTPGHGNLEHFCLRIEPFDAAALHAHLARFGIDCGEPARRYGADGEGPSIYLDDPEGNRVELKGPPQAR